MHRHLSGQPVPYRGVLFIGLMIDASGDPFVVEFNVRFGDPECQVTLPLVETDMFDLLHGAATDGLSDLSLSIRQGTALTVVLASEGYPSAPVKGRPIRGLEQALETAVYGKTWVNLAGVGVDESGQYIATGGRVLSCSALGVDVKRTKSEAYRLLSEIHLEGAHFRTDIAHRAMQ
tara:strand:- start:62 stop:589 length:528 start_codon:yes stop_codon:yes gene_type:complete